MDNMLHKKKHGFTLTEILLVLAISLLLVVAAIPIYGRLHTFSQIQDAEDQLRQTLHIARQQSFSRLNDAAHGVKFLNGSFVLFQGDSYAARQSAYDRVIDLDAALSLSSTLGGDEVIFSEGLALPSATGTVDINHSTGGLRTIAIQNLGIIE